MSVLINLVLWQVKIHPKLRHMLTVSLPPSYSIISAPIHWSLFQQLYHSIMHYHEACYKEVWYIMT